ncbi:MAG: thermonuclease family protein [archaeon]
MKRSNLWLLIIFLISGLLYYTFIDNFSSTGNAVKKVSVFVERAVDGDTLELKGGERVRLLGINTPEKKEFYGAEASNFTKQLENQTVYLETSEKDKYGRSLGYVFLNDKLFNEEIIKNGYAHFYSYADDKYTNQLKKAESFARENERGIWQKSENFGCLIIKELKYLEDGKRCTNKEQIILQNFCGTLNVTIKDDATHIEHVLIQKGLFEKNYSCIWNDAGDTLFIWDKTGLLVFERYP